MQAEILTVGTELLLGQIVNTNAVYLSRRLSEIGIDLFRQTSVGDNVERVRIAVGEALERADLVIVTGGLGPTADDVTTEAVALALGRELVTDEASATHLRAFLTQRGVPVLESHFKQARVPAGARVMPNPVGTAPGFIADAGGKAVATLPGVPAEMEAMFTSALLPELRRRASGAVIHSRVLRFVGIGESSLEDLVADLMAAQSNPTLAPLAHTGEVHLRLTAKAPSVAAAEVLLDELEARVRERAGAFLYGRDDETLEAALGARLRAAGWTLAAAESCTGGLIGHRITQVAGSSDYFRGSLVTYANQAKMDLLDVPEAVIGGHGAVSEETARAMAAGARRRLKADVAIAVTGIAGPDGGTADKPVGLVYMCFAGPDGDKCERHQLGGTRDMIKWRAATAALALALRETARQAQHGQE